MLEDLILAIYFISILALSIFGAHGFVLVYYYLRIKKEEAEGKRKKLNRNRLKNFSAMRKTFQLSRFNFQFITKFMSHRASLMQ
jgi:hypothetical protein